VKAEIGIAETGRPFLCVTPESETEKTLMLYIRPWMPLDIDPGSGKAYLVAKDSLPGSGKAG